MAGTLRILGIDPGSRVTGYGVIDSDGRRTRYVASGVIRAADAELAQRLGRIFVGIDEVVRRHRPAQVAVERVFVNRNVDSALKLGHARGAAICATFGVGAELFEYAARAVKLAVVGHGAADKQQVQHMVRILLALPEPPGEDEADALAIALCHAHSIGIPQRKRAAASWRDFRP